MFFILIAIFRKSSYTFDIVISDFMSCFIVPSCKALRTSAEPTKADGEYVIYPAGNPVKVYCDMTTDGGKLA